MSTYYMSDVEAERFFEECESPANIRVAPPNFTASVMEKIAETNRMNLVKIKPFTVGKKLGAALCFCAAALIMLSAVSEFGVVMHDFIFASSDKINGFINIIATF